MYTVFRFSAWQNNVSDDGPFSKKNQGLETFCRGFNQGFDTISNLYVNQICLWELTNNVYNRKQLSGVNIILVCHIHVIFTWCEL